MSPERRLVQCFELLPLSRRLEGGGQRLRGVGGGKGGGGADAVVLLGLVERVGLGIVKVVVVIHGLVEAVLAPVVVHHGRLVVVVGHGEGRRGGSEHWERGRRKAQLHLPPPPWQRSVGIHINEHRCRVTSSSDDDEQWLRDGGGWVPGGGCAAAAAAVSSSPLLCLPSSPRSCRHMWSSAERSVSHPHTGTVSRCLSWSSTCTTCTCNNTHHPLVNSRSHRARAAVPLYPAHAAIVSCHQLMLLLGSVQQRCGRGQRLM